MRVNMRTKGQHQRLEDTDMTRIATILRQSRETLLADTAGVVLLAVFIMGMLHLPGLV